jgi:hypothetical protein
LQESRNSGAFLYMDQWLWNWAATASVIAKVNHGLQEGQFHGEVDRIAHVAQRPDYEFLFFSFLIRGVSAHAGSPFTSRHAAEIWAPLVSTMLWGVACLWSHGCRRLSMPSSASRLRRASHTSGSSLDINRPLRSITVTLLPKRRIALNGPLVLRGLVFRCRIALHYRWAFARGAQTCHLLLN